MLCYGINAYCPGLSYIIRVSNLVIIFYYLILANPILSCPVLSCPILSYPRPLPKIFVSFCFSLCLPTHSCLKKPCEAQTRRSHIYIYIYIYIYLSTEASGLKVCEILSPKYYVALFSYGNGVCPCYPYPLAGPAELLAT
jgi:hypothetical protein